MPSRNGDGGGEGADANATKWRPVGRALRVARREDAREAMGIRIADRVDDAMGMIRAADEPMNLLRLLPSIILRRTDSLVRQWLLH